jgi:hypothetical protein
MVLCQSCILLLLTRIIYDCSQVRAKVLHLSVVYHTISLIWPDSRRNPRFFTSYPLFATIAAYWFMILRHVRCKKGRSGLFGRA